MENNDITQELDEIYTSDRSDLDKLTLAFELITNTILKYSDHEIEVQRALRDKDKLVKEQIKNGTIKHVRSVFNHCYTRIMGKKAWDE